MKTVQKGNWFEIIIPEKWTTFTLDDLLRTSWKVPKKMLHQFKMEKKVLLNGALPDWHKKLISGVKLQIELFTPEAYGVIPTYHDIEILYEDEHLLVLNKPAGMDTHPNEPTDTNTLANAVAFHLQANGIKLKPRHIHRLDRDTTGAVLFAKTALAGAMLDRMLEKREIKRTYLAIVEGLLHKKHGTINKPIGSDRHHPVRRRVSPTGQTAITHFKVLKSDRNENNTLIQCHLDTGRTHQIRVHFSDIGHPLVGDSLYGGSNIYSRQALHAIKLEFTHPFTEEFISCYAPFIDRPAIFKNIDPSSY
ncbi:RluA family pseudouridine synthase [Bacillus sp. B15-48]|uniref:RluA family pseudouridine synthase n=1 Tax=Bacillus sp. B15-48 TaxID=1548601 RepID=UPI00193FD64B|nr:RluA family pseudouridine synthase [Bacillus sp. B15-48]